MASNAAKAAVGALAASGAGNGNQGTPLGSGPVPSCPYPPLAHFHDKTVCETRPVRLNKGADERKAIFDSLGAAGVGATMVPNQKTTVCPMDVQSLESSSAVKGFDTTWIVENTGSKETIVSWVVDGVEWSPFHPDMKAVDDPQARVRPGEWLNVPTFESFVYHVREVSEDGSPGQVVLQHRVGFVPIGNPNGISCDLSKPDVEPVNPETAERVKEYSRIKTPEVRKCNVVDVSFRNQAGCPLHVYWASGIEDIPDSGFTCGERFRFHLGTKPATQNYMEDWDSATKFEGSFVGHTFVARLASDPNVVVDSYTVETTKIVDCPNLNQKVASGGKQSAEAVVAATGTVDPVLEPPVDGVDAQGDRLVAGGGSSTASM
eukprot:Nitzschia sp. Nitz4//scaffold79_size90958//42746//43998//NITZ4_005025-RA/size90958-augustus-gene-0.171-mRNA-1//1//CDS//3329558249//2520//frame0